MSNDVNINGATDRTSIKCHKIYKNNRESCLVISFLDVAGKVLKVGYVAGKVLKVRCR